MMYARDAGDQPEGTKSHLRRQRPASVMVWVAFAFEAYVQMFRQKVLPWVTKTFSNRYIFTQNGAPAHTPRLTQKRCKYHFSDFWDETIWPPLGPDINPMDFAIWSILDSTVSARLWIVNCR